VIANELSDRKLYLKEFRRGEFKQAVAKNEIDTGITYDLTPAQDVETFELAMAG